MSNSCSHTSGQRASSSLLLPMDAIWSSASASATRSQAEESEISSSAVPEASVDSQPFQDVWTPRIRGTWPGKSRARSRETVSSWELGSPVALNQRAPSFVSRRMRLKVGLAFHCRKRPVTRRPNGLTCSSTHRKSSRSQPGLANGPGLAPLA